jgi:hypothetical protein
MHGTGKEAVWTKYGWCYSNWSEWNSTLFPEAAKAAAVGGAGPIPPFIGEDTAVYYMSPFCNSTVHRRDFPFVDIGKWAAEIAEVHPDSSRAFYKSILRPAVRSWGMRMLFLDFICWRGPHLVRSCSVTLDEFIIDSSRCMYIEPCVVVWCSKRPSLGIGKMQEAAQEAVHRTHGFKVWQRQQPMWASRYRCAWHVRTRR